MSKENILNKFSKVCDNIHPVRRSDGSKVWYKHPAVAEICARAEARGDDYFYLTPEFQYPIQEVEPHYIYKASAFTEEEYNELAEMLEENKMKWIFEKYIGDGAIYARCDHCGWEYNCSTFDFSNYKAEISCVHKYCPECGRRAENSEMEYDNADIIRNKSFKYDKYNE